ncbi:MAG: hypothetical protein Q9171_000467 [Xanthocarpia ochracea]
MSAVIQRDGKTQNDDQPSSRFSFTGSEETLNGLYRTPATTPTSTKCAPSSSECTTPYGNNCDLFSSAVPLNLQSKVSSKGQTTTSIVRIYKSALTFRKFTILNANKRRIIYTAEKTNRGPVPTIHVYRDHKDWRERYMGSIDLSTVDSDTEVLEVSMGPDVSSGDFHAGASRHCTHSWGPHRPWKLKGEGQDGDGAAHHVAWFNDDKSVQLAGMTLLLSTNFLGTRCGTLYVTTNNVEAAAGLLDEIVVSVIAFLVVNRRWSCCFCAARRTWAKLVELSNT